MNIISSSANAVSKDSDSTISDVKKTVSLFQRAHDMICQTIIEPFVEDNNPQRTQAKIENIKINEHIQSGAKAFTTGGLLLSGASLVVNGVAITNPFLAGVALVFVGYNANQVAKNAKPIISNPSQFETTIDNNIGAVLDVDCASKQLKQNTVGFGLVIDAFVNKETAKGCREYLTLPKATLVEKYFSR